MLVPARFVLAAALALVRPPTAAAASALANPLACDAGTASTSRRESPLRSLRALATLPAIADALTDDAVLLWPGAAILPADDARRLLAAADAASGARLQWEPLGLRIAGDSASAATWGTLLHGTPDPAGTRVALEARYIAVLRRAGDCWRLAALMLDGVPTREARAAAPLALARAADPFVDADRAFAADAAASGAGPAFARAADEQAQMRDRDGLVVTGPAAIGRLVDGPARWGWAPVAAGAAGSGDLGWTAGNAAITGPDGTTHFSKYLTIWHRRDDGRIRFLTDGGNARPAD